MAAGDYRSCDVCGGKVFYDANLNYEDGGSEDRPPYRIAGQDQYDTPEKIQKWGTRLDYVGDWAVICTDCAKTHKCIVVPSKAHPAESSGGDAVAALRAEVESLRLFANEIMGEWWEGDLDGGSRQDIAERHGLIAAFEVTEPCGEHCNCAELGEWPTECFRRTPLLTGDAAIASGAECGG